LSIMASDSNFGPAIEKPNDGTTDYVPTRSRNNANFGKPHINTQPINWGNWHRHINWLNALLVLIIPVGGLIYSYWIPLRWQTAVFTVIYYFMSGLGITAGYHRLWSHSSYRASLTLRIYLAAVGAGAVQGSIRWWSRKHRAHHRYTDTVKDPHSIQKGFLYSHLGWMIMNQDPKRTERTDVSDLDGDTVVMWQHVHYLKCLIVMAIIFPTMVCGIGWGDWMGGFIYSGVLRYSFVQQATFCINSVAHWLGDQPFNDRNSPRDHVVTALITLGEGYHNFHHEFPSDYRNAIEWYQYDPSKWMIWLWKSKLDWGVPLENLPVVIWDDFVIECRKNGKALVAIAGIIYDVHEFINDHPGGKALISSAIAHNLLSTYRVAVLRGGCEVEIWKRAQSENKPLPHRRLD
ncbi:acyl-CoA desaturase, partial [Colletotrichum tofieldiae]